jgi:tRNA 2-thiouridine synthesizing protein D
MNFAIAVFAGPYTSAAPLSALHFSRAVLAAGHEISRVFFYHDGVYTANVFSAPPQDEPDLTQAWSALSAEHNLDLVVCVASALRRGVLDEAEASRYEKAAMNLAPGFTISGLGQLIDSALSVDRLVTFK